MGARPKISLNPGKKTQSFASCKSKGAFPPSKALPEFGRRSKSVIVLSETRKKFIWNNCKLSESHLNFNYVTKKSLVLKHVSWRFGLTASVESAAKAPQTGSKKKKKTKNIQSTCCHRESSFHMGFAPNPSHYSVKHIRFQTEASGDGLSSCTWGSTQHIHTHNQAGQSCSQMNLKNQEFWT